MPHTPVPERRSATLVLQLAALRAVPVSGDDADIVEQWLDDWETFLDDRRAHAERLLAGEDAELLVTARAGRQITATGDNFARVNRAPSCVTPLDV